jgi:hypothetical protein
LLFELQKETILETELQPYTEPYLVDTSGGPTYIILEKHGGTHGGKKLVSPSFVAQRRPATWEARYPIFPYITTVKKALCDMIFVGSI